MSQILKNKLLLIFIIGLIIRLALAFLPGFQIDVNDWFAWAIRLSQVGLDKFYNQQVFSDYTPGYMYVLGLLGFLKNQFSRNDNLFYLILKIPAITADLFLSIFIYQVFKKRLSHFYASLAFCFTFFNPALIFNSTIWGQIDSIPTLFMFWAIYFLEKQSLVLSSVSVGIAFLIKPQTAALLPVFTLFIINNLSLRNFLRLILPFLIVTTLFSLPFFSTNFLGLWGLIYHSTNQYPYTSIFAYNFWGIFGFWIHDSQRLGLSFQMIGYLLFIIYWLLILYFNFKKSLSIYSLALLSTISFFFLLTRMHERYLYPGLVFLILVSIQFKSRLLILLSVILSFLHLLNLYYVYVYYNEIYLKSPKLLYNPMVYNFLDNNGKTLSFISTIIFVIITYVVIKISYVSKKVNI